MKLLSTMLPIYIFDLDDTLSLTDHRRHFLEGVQDWDSFYRAAAKDAPNLPIIAVFNALLAQGSEVMIFTGRSSNVRQQTIKWLRLHTNYANQALFMRTGNDTTPDHVLKKRWLEDTVKPSDYHKVCVFDDRQSVVDMWRSLGITCCQVAPGAF